MCNSMQTNENGGVIKTADCKNFFKKMLKHADARQVSD